jgi:uncharacterized surface protein with fasciclin (FAS1) repeats
MKRWALFILLGINSFFVFGQKSALRNPVKDSVKTKWGFLKIIDGSTMVPSNDIIQNIAQAKEYSVLVNAIACTGLTETFKSKGPITIFAPTDQAFAKLPAGQMDTLLKPVHKYDLSYLITYHAIAGRLSVKDIEKLINSNNGQALLTTIAGIKITAHIDANRNIVLVDENGGESVISKFDIRQSNGMLHVVNAVLVPKNKTI